MHTFTGYEPNKFVGKGPEQRPTTLGPAQTTGSVSSSSAAQQIVVPTADDISNLFDAEMSSLLEDLFEDPLMPLADINIGSEHPGRDCRAPILEPSAISAKENGPLVPPTDIVVQSGLGGLAAHRRRY